MRAMLLAAPAPIERNPLTASDVPAPEPTGGDLRIRVGVCGACRTDLHTVEGDLDLPRLPVIPGHQIVGAVESLGDRASRFAVGARVGVPWLHSACGRCRYCTSGRENLCDGARFTGYHVDGGYAEYVIAPEDFVYAIPEELADDARVAPLLCGGVIGLRALRLSEIEPGGRLGLYGFGSSAHIALQIARHWGCEVCVFTRGREHQELASEMGATWIGRAEENPGGELDAAVIFAPAGRLVHEALRVLRKGGTVSLAGVHMSPIPGIDYRLIYGERTMRSVANSTRKDVEDLLALAPEVPLHTEVAEFPLADANRVLAMLKRSEIRASAVFSATEW